jgi:hypothetical protein
MAMAPYVPDDFRFTFLLGVRVRSGTNYVGKIMSCNPHVQLVPSGKSTDEFPMLRVMDSWEKAFGEFARRYKGERDTFQFRRFLPHFGGAWLRYIIETFDLPPGHIFLKDPNVRFVDLFFDMFPNVKLLILVRDGRDNVASSVKAGLARRSRDSLIERSRHGANHLLRRDFVLAARDWASAVDRILAFDEKFRDTPRSGQYLLLRYEDIFRNPKEMAARIFSFMGVAFDEQILEAVARADVVGSSFYGTTGREDARKPNWRATPKTDAFQPLGRWGGWSPLRKRMFKRLAGSQLIRMGYEKDLNWG